MNKLKKSLSVLLTLVMLFTTLCFFVIPEAGIEANAAATTYKWRVTVYMTKGSKNTDSGNVTIYWKTNNGTGSEGSAQIYSGSGSGAIWQDDGQTTTFVSDSSLSGTVKSGVVPANAYPYKATATIDLGSAFSSKIQWAVKLEVLDAQGNVYVNDKLLEEPYIKEKAFGQCNLELPYQVPESRIFVMGDHRDVSIDSRHTSVGCVSEEQIVGKLKLRVWPLNKIEIF